MLVEIHRSQYQKKYDTKKTWKVQLELRCRLLATPFVYINSFMYEIFLFTLTLLNSHFSVIQNQGTWALTYIIRFIQYNAKAFFQPINVIVPKCFFFRFKALHSNVQLMSPLRSINSLLFNTVVASSCPVEI